MAFTHKVREQTERIERSEAWHGQIDGYDVGVDRRHDGFTEAWVAPIEYKERMRLPLIKFYPKNVADIERVAAVLSSLLSAMVSEMRAAGLEDLRSTIDVMMDESDKALKAAILKAGGDLG